MIIYIAISFIVLMAIALEIDSQNRKMAKFLREIELRGEK